MDKRQKQKLIEKAIDALIDIRDDAYEYYHPVYEQAISRLNDDNIKLAGQIDD